MAGTCVVLADGALPSPMPDPQVLCGGSETPPPPGHAIVVLRTGGMASAEPILVSPTATGSSSCAAPSVSSYAVVGTVWAFGCFTPPNADAARERLAAMVQGARSNGNASASGPQIPLPAGVSATLVDPATSPITAADALAAVPAELGGPDPEIRLERITAWPYVRSEARPGTVLWVVYARPLTTACASASACGQAAWSFVSNHAQLIRSVRQP